MPDSTAASQSHLRLPRYPRHSSQSPSSSRRTEDAGRPSSSQASDSSPVLVPSPSASSPRNRSRSPLASSSTKFTPLQTHDDEDENGDNGKDGNLSDHDSSTLHNSQGSPDSWSNPNHRADKNEDADDEQEDADDDEDNGSEYDYSHRRHSDAEQDPNMSSARRPSEGRAHDPLLNNPKSESYDAPVRDPDRSRRRSILRERDPALEARIATRKRYTYAACFLILSLISFTVQTETAVYIQHNLKWNKAYAMLYVTHGSWTMLWFLQLAILRIQKRKMPWNAFWSRHVQILRQTALMVQHQDVTAPEKHYEKSPVPYMLRTTAFVTCALTVAGGSWYVAVDLTTASDLTAIYNCSAFFAYVFSVPILKEKVRWTKVTAVLVAVAGVIVVAYGDATPAKHGSKSGGGAGGPQSADNAEGPRNRSFGNLVIAVGSVLYGLYEVLYKRLACPPDGASPGRSMIFANCFGSLIGAFTLLVLWIPIPILHVLKLEIFEWPTGEASWMLVISVLGNANQFLPAPLNNPLSAATIAGGVLIIVAFVVLCWATYREMDEERKKKAIEQIDDSDEDVDL